MVDIVISEKCLHIRHSIGCVVVVVGRAVFPGQHRVVVAPDVWCGELAQNVLGLMEGHQTHAKQGEAENTKQTRETLQSGKLQLPV